MILSRLSIRTYWTTNYDSLIEDSFRASGKIVDVKCTLEQLVNTKPNREAVVYKMNGDKEHWIPWEISYSLKEVSRKNKNGDAIMSKTNAMIAFVLL